METQNNYRLRNLAIFTGVLLALGILLPILIPDFDFRARDVSMKLAFPNFMAQSVPQLPGSIKLWLLFPLIGSVLCFVAINMKQSMPRAIMFFVAGFIPFFLSQSVLGNIGAAAAILEPRGRAPYISGPGTVLMMLGLGLFLLIAAAHSGRLFPQKKSPPILAAVGAAALFIALIVPISAGEPRGFRGGADAFSTSLLSGPFTAMNEDGLAGFLLLMILISLLAAVGLGIFWVVKRKEGVNLALPLRIALNSALLFTVVTIAVAIGINEGGGDVGMMIPIAILGVTKIIVFLLGFLWAKSMFVMELVAHGDELKAKLMAATSNPAAPSNTPPAAPPSSMPLSDSSGQDSFRNETGTAPDLAKTIVDVPPATPPVAPPPAAEVPSSVSSIEKRLEELKVIRDKGLLTQAEYEVKRKSLIDQL